MMRINSSNFIHAVGIGALVLVALFSYFFLRA